MVTFTVASCGEVIPKQSTVLDGNVNGTSFNRHFYFIGADTSTFSVYSNTLASVRLIAAYLLVHGNRFSNHGINRSNLFFIIEDINMRFCLARCIGSYFYGQIVIQTQCTIVLVIETEGDNRCAIILVYAHKG